MTNHRKTLINSYNFQKHQKIDQELHDHVLADLVHIPGGTRAVLNKPRFRFGISELDYVEIH